MPFVVAHSVALLGLMSITNAKLVGSTFLPTVGNNAIRFKHIYEMDLPYKITFFRLPMFHFIFLQSVQIKLCNFSSLENKKG